MSAAVTFYNKDFINKDWYVVFTYEKEFIYK